MFHYLHRDAQKSSGKLEVCIARQGCFGRVLARGDGDDLTQEGVGIVFWFGVEDEVKVIAEGMGDAFFGCCLKHGGEGMALQGMIPRVGDDDVDACAAQSREGFYPVVSLAVHDVIARLSGILPVCKGGGRWCGTQNFGSVYGMGQKTRIVWYNERGTCADQGLG